MKRAVIIMIGLLLVGCVGPVGFGTPHSGPNASTPNPTTAPAHSANVTQQAGQGNVAANTDVGVKGIEYHSDLPWRAVVLFGILIFSRSLDDWLYYRSKHQ